MLPLRESFPAQLFSVDPPFDLLLFSSGLLDVYFLFVLLFDLFLDFINFVVVRRGRLFRFGRQTAFGRGLWNLNEVQVVSFGKQVGFAVGRKVAMCIIVALLAILLELCASFYFGWRLQGWNSL